jgi:hypothetical protein
MASVPSTPDGGPRSRGIARSFTLPSKLATPSRNAPTAEIGAADGIETLFVHPTANVVKFTTSGPGSTSPRSAAFSGRAAGTLPWASPTERTMAAGQLEIYRVPGSVSFLHSGALLHAILPRSQCWCVDGVSKFALRVLPDTYYRIELPGETPEDLAKVEEMKETLAKVLFYEKTPCPFARTFTVELPEQPEERRKGRRKSHGPAKKWKQDRAYKWRPEDGEEPRRGSGDSGSGSLTSSDDDRTGAGGQKSDEDSSDAPHSADEMKMDIRTPSRLPAFTGAGVRSVTSPTELRTRPLGRVRTEPFESGGEGSRKPMPIPSRLGESRLRTFQPIPTDMPPSPPDSSAGMEMAETPSRLDGAAEDRKPIIEQHQEEEVEVESSVIHHHGFPEEAEGGADEEMTAPYDHNDNDNEPKQAEISATTEQEIRTEHATQSDRETMTDLGPRPQTPTQAPIPAPEPQPGPHREPDPHPERPQQGPNTGSEPQPDSTIEPELEPRPKTPTQVPLRRTTSNSEDPFAAIQARILARRSIGGTTSFHPHRNSPTRSSTSSNSSSATIASRSSASASASVARRDQQSTLASAMVKKACSVFLGPPAHLVAIMLRIAARFASGTLRSVFYVESPVGESRKVPGSFNLDRGIDSDSEDEVIGEWEREMEEDDFGVPLRSPIRLANLGDAGSTPFMRERERGRRGWDVE